MKHAIDDPEVRNYLAALEARLAQLPTEQSEEISFGVREHIAEAMQRGGQSTSEILAGLGSPDDIAAGLTVTDAATPGTVQQQLPPYQYQQMPQPAPRHQSTTLWVVATGILLPFGGFLAGIGWLFGLAGLWMGTRWKTWEKIMGTVLLPGGIAGSVVLAAMPFWFGASGQSSTQDGTNPLIPGLPIGGVLALVCLPILVAVYLLVVGLRRGPAKK